MKTFKNYLYNLAYQLSVVIVPLITTPYVSRVLRPDGVGKVAYSQTVIEYFIMFGILGMTVFGSRQIAYVRDDEETKSQTFWDLNLTRTITMLIACVIYAIYCVFRKENQSLYVVQSFTLLASLIDISWYYSGVEKFKVTGIVNITVKLCSVLLVFLLVKEEQDINLYAIIVSLSAFIGQAILWLGIRKEVTYKKPNLKNVMSYLVGSFKLWLPTIAASVYTSFDKIILGWFTTDDQIGFYANSQKLVRAATIATSTLSTVTIPKVSYSFSNNKYDEIKETVNLSMLAVSFLAFPMCFGLMGVRETIVPWFYGEGYEPIIKLLLVSSLLIITLSWSSILANQVLVATKRENLYTLSIVIAAVINIGLNFVLIPKLQALGALITSVLAEYIGMFIMMWFSRKLISLPRFFKSVLKYLVTSVCMYFIVFYMGHMMPKTILTTVIQLAVGVGFYFIVMLIIKDKVLFMVIDEIKKKLKLRIADK